MSVCAAHRISSILVMMFSAYERSRSRVTRSLTLSWSSLASSTSATVRPILRFCLYEQTRSHALFSVSAVWLKLRRPNRRDLPEILKVPLDVWEQRVLQGLNMLSVNFLWDQFRPPPICKHKDTVVTRFTGGQDSGRVVQLRAIKVEEYFPNHRSI